MPEMRHSHLLPPFLGNAVDANVEGVHDGVQDGVGMWRYRTMLSLYWNARKKKEGKHPTTALARSSRDGIDL